MEEKLFENWKQLENSIRICKDCKLCQNRNKVVIGEGCYCIDRYYGFPNSTQKMSNIIDVQEFVHTNCVHPNRMGYEQEGQDYFVTILDMLQTIEAEN